MTWAAVWGFISKLPGAIKAIERLFDSFIDWRIKTRQSKRDKLMLEEARALVRLERSKDAIEQANLLRELNDLRARRSQL